MWQSAAVIAGFIAGLVITTGMAMVMLGQGAAPQVVDPVPAASAWP